MKTILLVDDDQQFRTALKSLMAPLGKVILEAADGVLAAQVFQEHKVDLVISDIRMPNSDGVELLKWIKERSSVPVILVTGFAEILETMRASELGADGFLPKPFKFEEISGLVQELLDENRTLASKDDVDGQYCKIPVEEFVTGSRIKFNVFHRITNSKYIKIAHNGEDIEATRIRNFKAKGMRNLYLTREDFSKYVGFNLNLAKKLGNTQIVSNERKINFLRYTSELVMERLFVEGPSRVEYEVAADFVQTTINLVKEQEEAFALLEALNRHADFLYAHSLGVGLYGVMLARELKWHWGPTLFKISLSGLMHDIGFKEIPRSILETPRLALTQEERHVYETHTTRGMELLNQVKVASEDVITIAYQHHEDCLGAGYPQQLGRQRTHPLARLISLVDAFCECTITSPGSTPLSAHDAIVQLRQRETTFDPEYFSALKRVFKYADAEP